MDKKQVEDFREAARNLECDVSEDRFNAVLRQVAKNKAKEPVTPAPARHSEITCPQCGHRKTEEMPTDACQFFYECQSCGTTLRPKEGDCCVFCSYGSVPCPPIQIERQGGAASCCSSR